MPFHPLYRLAQNSAEQTPTSTMTRTRRYVDLLAPDPNCVHFEDLRAGAEQPRFRCHTTRPISVAEHSLRVARIGLAFGEPLEVLLALLLHDTPEFFLVDMPGPIKKHVRVQLLNGAIVPWRELEDAWTTAICRALLPDGLAATVAGLINAPSGPVATYDHMALQVEALLWMPGGEDWTKPAELDARVWAAAIEHPGWTWADATRAMLEYGRLLQRHAHGATSRRPNWPARTDFRREILGPVLG